MREEVVPRVGEAPWWRLRLGISGTEMQQQSNRAWVFSMGWGRRAAAAERIAGDFK